MMFGRCPSWWNTIRGLVWIQNRGLFSSGLHDEGPGKKNKKGRVQTKDLFGCVCYTSKFVAPQSIWRNFRQTSRDRVIVELEQDLPDLCCQILSSGELHVQLILTLILCSAADYIKVERETTFGSWCLGLFCKVFIYNTSPWRLKLHTVALLFTWWFKYLVELSC